MCHTIVSIQILKFSTPNILNKSENAKLLLLVKIAEEHFFISIFFFAK